MIILDRSLALHTAGIAYFRDITGTTSGNGYAEDGNITYSDVDGVRIKTGTYTTLAFPSSPEGGDFVQYTEYIKTGGTTEVINDKTFVAGSIFVPQFASLSTLQPESWSTTGYYVYPFLATWLPTAAETPLDISVAKFGQVGNVIYDNIYVYEYGVYYNSQVTSFTSVSGLTYMVLAGTATYLGDIFYAGEIFTASDASTVTVTDNVVTLYAATSAYATLVPVIIADLNELIQLQIGKNNQDLVEPIEGYILKIRTKLEALEYACATQNVSLLFGYETIVSLQEKLNLLLSPLR